MKTFKGYKGKWCPYKRELFGIEKTTVSHSVYCGTTKIAKCWDKYETNNCEEIVAEANAKLIADAGNTIQKCGLFPSELLKQRNELLEALQSLSKLIDNGDLVRDISKDDDKSYYISQGIRIVNAIGKYQKAINKAL